MDDLHIPKDAHDIWPIQDASSITEKTLNEEIAWKGSFLTVDKVTIELPNGNTSTREIVRHPGAVGILVIDDEDNVLLVAQSRTALGRILVEIPAGKLDAGEDPEQAAMRELKEETGVRAKSLTPIVSVVTAAGFCDEVIHLYLARDLTFEDQALDEDEFLLTFWVPFDELYQKVEQGQITDAKTVMALLWYKNARCKV